MGGGATTMHKIEKRKEVLWLWPHKLKKNEVHLCQFVMI